MSQTTEQVKLSLQSRYFKERVFKKLGLSAIIVASLFLVLLFSNIIVKAMPAFTTTSVEVEVEFSPKILGVEAGVTDKEQLRNANYGILVAKTLYKQFPEVTTRNNKKKLKALRSELGVEYMLSDMVVADPSLIGKTRKIEFLLDDDVDAFIKAGGLEKGKPINDRINQDQINWLKKLADNGQIKTHFNWSFFTNTNSSQPELAGIYGAVIGTLLTIFVTMAISFPIGVFAAVYLEEFAPKNKLTDLIEININNLAAVPSIVFGLLGLAVFLNIFDVPRSSALAGGLVLALMTLPTIIISSRSAIKAVPPSLKEAALGLGASKMQTVFHQTLPLAMPGILTGAIIGVAQAIGETAPLLMIGMMNFIQNVPSSLFEDTTVLPMQIYLWSKNSEIVFTYKASAAILVLLVFLILINATAVYLRKKFEKKW